MNTDPREGPASDGGLAARRAVVRWAWRLFRREWPQQVLVVVMLAVTTGAAVVGTAIGFHAASLRAAELGTATHRLTLDGESGALDANLAAARRQFGTIETIGHRSVTVPGSVESVDVRAQDPHGPFGQPMLRLVAGRYPAGPGEVAVSDGTARLLATGIGRDVAVGGRDATVVGLVENPSDLGDEFVLVPPGSEEVRATVTVLVSADADTFDSFVGAIASDGVLAADSRGQTEAGTAAGGVLAGMTVVMILVGLVAVAGFLVIAQRRQRQLGMLAALGATQQHLRLVTLANGGLVGAVAAVAGTAVGLAGWAVAAPLLEPVVEHRIDLLHLPWWAIGTSIGLAIVTATVAAWWPARMAARLPITRALSTRPARPRPVHRSATLAVLLVAAGVASLAVGLDPAEDKGNVALLLVGTVALVAGTLLFGPTALRVLGAVAGRTPVAVRVGLRDLARYQSRSAAALAAISLVLGIPAAAAIITSAAEATARQGPDNLSDRQMLIRIGGDRNPKITSVLTTQELDRMQTAVDHVARSLGDPAVLPLDMAVDPSAASTPLFDGTNGTGRFAYELSQPGTEPYLLYVATPEIFEFYGLDPALVPQDVEVFTGHPGDFVFLPNDEEDPIPVTSVARIEVPEHTSAPTSFITPAALRRHGWEPTPAAWFIEAGQPLTDRQLAEARRRAALAGLAVESRAEPRSNTAAGWGAVGAGTFLALAVLALTVGLIRSETAGEMRTLTAVGAARRIRRTISAATAGGLALLGMLLATIAAYLAVAASYHRDLDLLADAPLIDLAMMLLGVPLVATVAGWLLAGREPRAIAGQDLT